MKMANHSNEKRMSTPKTKIRKTNSEKTDVTKKNSKGGGMDLTKSDKKKKIWSSEALYEMMQPSTEELEYRKEKAKESDFVQKYSKLFKCTKCQFNFKPLIVKHEKVPTHPCLGVLMCQKCSNYYGNGEFSLDSDGEDKYCRWCGEGGTIFSCSQCICGFCRTCIKRHFKIEYFKQVQNDEDWLCFFCNPKPLWDHRFICSLAIEMSETKTISTSTSNINKEENVISPENLDTKQNSAGTEEDLDIPSWTSKRKKLSKTKKRSKVESTVEMESTSCKSPLNIKVEGQNMNILSSSSDESDTESPLKRLRCTSTPLKKEIKKKNDSFENIKSGVLSELKKTLTLTKYQMDFGMSWSNNMLEKLATPDITTHDVLLKECQRVKRFLSIMSTYLVQFSNSADSLEKTLQRNEGQKVNHDFPDKDQSYYNNILQFLSFIRGQVKVFMEQGVSPTDVFEADLYTDDKIIGIKRKLNPLSGTSTQERSKSPSTESICKSSDNGIGKEHAEQAKSDEFNKSRDEEDIFELVRNPSMEKEDVGVEENDDKDQGSSNKTSSDLNELRNEDTKDDIREILAILENA